MPWARDTLSRALQVVMVPNPISAVGHIEMAVDVWRHINVVLVGRIRVVMVKKRVWRSTVQPLHRKRSENVCEKNHMQSWKLLESEVLPEPRL